MRLKKIPCAPDVRLGRTEMTDREPQDESVMQPRMREEHVASGVYGVEQALVKRVEVGVGHVARARAEADDAERHRCDTFEISGLVHPHAEQLSEADVF